MNGHPISTRMSYSAPTVLLALTSQYLRTSSAGFSTLLESRYLIELLSIPSLSAKNFQWSSAKNNSETKLFTTTTRFDDSTTKVPEELRLFIELENDTTALRKPFRSL